MVNGKPLILAVDDEEPIRNLITYTFEPHNLEVITAENGKSAITILEHNPVDVIITDLLMPSMTGLALIREMKKRKSSIPIIIITAYGNTEMVKEIIAEGVFRLIEKPLDFDVLVPIVQEAIEYKNNKETHYEEPEIFALSVFSLEGEMLENVISAFYKANEERYDNTVKQTREPLLLNQNKNKSKLKTKKRR